LKERGDSKGEECDGGTKGAEYADQMDTSVERSGRGGEGERERGGEIVVMKGRRGDLRIRI